ncbi:unnamed protein product [Urochloa humidicola]
MDAPCPVGSHLALTDTATPPALPSLPRCLGLWWSRKQQTGCPPANSLSVAGNVLHRVLHALQSLACGPRRPGGPTNQWDKVAS